MRLGPGSYQMLKSLQYFTCVTAALYTYLISFFTDLESFDAIDSGRVTAFKANFVYVLIFFTIFYFSCPDIFTGEILISSKQSLSMKVLIVR